MSTTVFTRSFTLPDFDIKEILRYMGAKSEESDILKLVYDCIKECSSCIAGNVCYGIFDAVSSDHGVIIQGNDFRSDLLCRKFANCNEVILFAATIGLGIDRLIRKYSSISPSAALCFQAIGTERIEQLCDAFEKDIKKQYKETVPRLSPGYSDFDLLYQKDIFRILDCQRKIGLTLNESMIMSPSKC